MSTERSATWADRYSLAERMLNAAGTVGNGTVLPHWIDGRSFWYRRSGPTGEEYRMVEAATGKNYVAFTAHAVAEALTEHLDADVDSEQLILRDVRIMPEHDRADFTTFGRAYSYVLSEETISETTRTGNVDWSVSPDGRHAAFVRDDNLWMRDIDSGAERAVTTDGTEYHAYACKPSPQRRSIRELVWPAPPEGNWSPDSKRFLSLQVDERHVPDLAVMEFAPEAGVRPRVSANKTSLPGDAKVTEFRVISIEVETGRQTEARYPRLPAVRMNDTPFSANLAWWSSDSRTAYFVDVERGERAVHVVAFDVVTGATRVLFTETSDTYVELSVSVYGPALLHALPETNELLWYSERSGHGHLYLYDLETGAHKGPVTSGPWQVRDVQHVDASRREVFFTAAGIAPEEDPYTCRPCLASLDGGAVTVLSDEPGDHLIWRPDEYTVRMLAPTGEDPSTVAGVSPTGDHFVETVGSVDRLPRTVLRQRTGAQVAVIETAEDQGLPDGWSWPEKVRLKAADGRTDTYGVLFKPWGYDPSRKYPVIDLIYGGPQSGYVPKSAFAQGGMGTDVQYLEAAHLAALGAFAVLIDGRGTANREREFREASYGAIHTASNITDHIAGIRELADRYPGMDLERVGICGFSGGGYATALAALRFGDFFKVAVAASGNYDQSLFWHSWGERYHGPFDAEHYAKQAAKTYASGLTGKLMFIHGLLDRGCHPAGLFQLIQTLIEQNKDVDLVLSPRETHKLSGYSARRRLDYFVTHLFGSTPPVGVSMTTGYEKLLEKARAANTLPTDARGRSKPANAEHGVA